MNEQLNATLMSWVQFFNEPLWDFLVIFLLAVGIFYTVLTGAVQIRMFLQSIRVMKSSRTEGEDEHGLTPFQAFVMVLRAVLGWVTLLVWQLRSQLVAQAPCSGCG